MSEFTPGPWRFVERETLEDGSVYPRHILGGASELEVCRLEGDVIAANPEKFKAHSNFSFANALLIAAGPELYRLLKACSDGLAFHAGSNDERVSDARAILARIEGE